MLCGSGTRFLHRHPKVSEGNGINAMRIAKEKLDEMYLATDS